MTRTIILAGYAAIFAAAILLHVTGAGWHRMSFAEFVGRFLRWPPIRWLFVIVWLWVGWHLFVRVDR